MTSPELISIPRSVLALLVRSTEAMADTYVLLGQHGELPVTIDDITGMRAAVILGRQALEGETEPW